MKKNFVKATALALAVSMMLTGCGGKDNGEAAKGKTTIRFATWDNAEDLDYQQELVDRFNESQEEIVVKLEAYGSEYDTKISAGMGSGDTPDVLYMWDYPTYQEALEPLDSYIEAEGEEFKADFYEALWPYNSIGDAVYGMPVGFTTHALFYNKDIFAEAGITEPTDDWTWEDLKAAAQTITEKTGIKGFAFQMKPDPYDAEMYAWSNGGAFVAEDGTLAGNLNSDKTVEAFAMLQQMEKDGYAAATEGNGTDEFRGGKAAMYIYGAWSIASFDKDGLNYGIVTIPSFNGSGKDSVSILSSSGLSIAGDSKNKKAAWEFIKYWTSEECNKDRIGYELPARKSVVEAENLMEDPKNAPFYTMLEQSAGYTPASFIVDNWSALSETLSLSFERIFNPSTLEDTKTVMDEAVN